jgi:hypothetical protein
MLRTLFMLFAASLAACTSTEPQDSPTRGPTGGGGSAGAPGGACESTFSEDTVRLAVGAKLSPGDEKTLCMRWTTPDALDITSFVGALGPAGHHSILIARPAGAEPDGVAPCSEAEIMDAQKHGSFQMLAGVSYESDGQRIDFPSQPVQIGLRVDAGTQLVFDAHFLDAGDKDIDACAYIYRPFKGKAGGRAAPLSNGPAGGGVFADDPGARLD